MYTVGCNGCILRTVDYGINVDVNWNEIYEISFDERGLSIGVYFLRIIFDNFTDKKNAFNLIVK